MALDIFGEEIEQEEVFDISRKKYKMFDFLGDITKTKRNILRQDSDAERDYSPWIINKMLSMNIETVLYSQEMNSNYVATKQMQYDFYISAIRPGYRKMNWVKDINNKDVKLLQAYYEINREKATDILSVLTKEQLGEIKMKMDKGGKK